MPTDIDPDKIRAEFKEGVLNVYCRGAVAKPKLIDVKVL
jgi:HSP20 family molecular chaperone IbpA